MLVPELRLDDCVAADGASLLAAADDAVLAGLGDARARELPLLVALQADDASEGVLVELVRAVVARDSGALLVEALYVHNARADVGEPGEPRGEAAKLLLLADDSRRRARGGAGGVRAAPAVPVNRVREVAQALHDVADRLGAAHARERRAAFAQRLPRVTREQIGAVLEAYGDALGTSFLGSAASRLAPGDGGAADAGGDLVAAPEHAAPRPSPSPPPGGAAETCAECGAVPKAAVRWYACPRCGRRFAVCDGACQRRHWVAHKRACARGDGAAG